MKKKFQIKALKTAETSTGKMSKEMAMTETVSNKIKATTRYPRKAATPKQIPDTARTSNMLIRNSPLRVSFLEKKRVTV